MPITAPAPPVVDDIDDIDAHHVSCVCSECVEGLVLELAEDRVA